MLGRVQPFSLSYYRYICLGLAGNLGIVSGPRNLFQEMHAINGVQSSEQPASGVKKKKTTQKADAEKNLQQASPPSYPSHPSILHPSPREEEQAWVSPGWEAIRSGGEG